MPKNDLIQSFMIKKLEEGGYVSAIRGLSLSYNATFLQASNAALKLSIRDLGHNKFLESIQTWWEIKAPRYWWSEMDTYRIGTSKQSESTMHTLGRKTLTKDDFAGNIPGCVIEYLNQLIEDKVSLEEIKAVLPEGFLQTRIMNINYKTLRNMILQRRNHRLKEWKIFCDEVFKQVEYPHLLPKRD